MLYDSPGMRLRGNNIAGNEWGVCASGDFVDARENWWGSITGPDSGPIYMSGPDNPRADPVYGAIIFTPWLLAPNPDAGA
jgi:hypothetical protein